VTETLAAPRGAIRNWAEYLLLRGFLGLVRVAPEAASEGLARVLGGLARRALPGRCRRASERVRTCLGLAPGDPRIAAIVTGAFQTLALNAVEPVVIERWLDAGHSLEGRIRIEGREHLSGAFASGRPLLICTAHIGAWETIPVLVSRLHRPIWAMARPLGNPLIERYLSARRLRSVCGTVSTDGGGLKLARLMKSNEALGLLLDQNAGSKGVILDFLGLPSSHHVVSGVMAQRFGALVVPLYLLREPDGRQYRFVIEPPIAADPGLPAEQAQLDVVVRVSRSMERMVRAYPDQWLWLHDRWRHALHVLSRQPEASTRPAEEHTQVAAVQGTNGA